MSVAPATIEAPIQAVTVYRRGAVVERQGPASSGSELLRVADLPLCLDDSSVVARLEGPGAPPITDVRIALEVTDQERPPPPEQAVLDGARAAERQARDRVEHLGQLAADLQTLRSPSRPDGKEGEAPTPVPTGARLALLAFRQEQLDQVAAQLTLAEDQLRLAVEERKARTEELRRASSARQPRAQELRKTAYLTTVAAPGPTEGDWRLVLEYRVPGARWTPSYSLHLDAELAQLRLVLRASVAQRTGEDWSGVSLTLSTAEPMRWTELPELPALRIGRRQATPRRTGWREPPQGADGLFADYDRARERLLPPPEPEPIPPPLRRPAPAAAMDMAVDDSPLAELEEEAPEPKLERRARSRAKKRAPRPAGPPQSAPPIGGFAASPQAMASGAAMPAGAAPPPQPTELTAPDALLDFGRLRLAAADSSRRGSLRPASRLVLYRESVQVEQRIELTRELVGLVDQAIDRARLSDLTLPPDHHPPQPFRDFDHAWRATHPVDVPSDGAWHGLTLLEAQAPARRHFVVVPREAREVFRFVAFDNPLDGPLPAGPADVFVGGSLLLGTSLRPADRAAVVRLGLGVEEGIRVARNSRFQERSSGLLGGSLALQHEVQIELANNLAVDARIEVRERVPVVREDDEEIELEEVRAEPPWQEWEQSQHPIRGAYRWQLDLPAGQERTLTARYTVKISARKELVGGNRREA